MKYHEPDKDGGPFTSPSGAIYHHATYEALVVKARDDPRRLTDAELGIIEAFGGTPEADRAAQAREQALHPDQLPAADLCFVDRLAAFVIEINERNKIRNARLDVLERDLGGQSVAAFVTTSLENIDLRLAAERTEMTVRVEHLRTQQLAHSAEVARLITEQTGQRAEVTKALLQRASQKDHVEFLERAVEELRTTVERLRTDLAAVTSKPLLRAGEVWKPDTAYTPGDTATWDGSLWRCVTAHRSGASISHDGFKLAVKKGRDGRDAKDAG
jgi:carbohydrate binding protein with CBM5/12 domain